MLRVQNTSGVSVVWVQAFLPIRRVSETCVKLPFNDCSSGPTKKNLVPPGTSDFRGQDFPLDVPMFRDFPRKVRLVGSFSHRGFSCDENPIWQCRLGTLLARATQFWGGELNMVGMQWRCDGYMC